VSKIRFATIRELFEAFPTAAEDVPIAAGDQAPLAFLKAQIEGPTPENALSLCAYLLPRREAVWWACQGVRAMGKPAGDRQAAALAAAEAWVREPEDDARRAALAVGQRGDPNAAETWAALGAGWSGGSMSLGDAFVPCAPQLTARAVRIAVLTALAAVPAAERRGRLRASLAGALALVGLTPETAR